jgi:hypothetical protein
VIEAFGNAISDLDDAIGGFWDGIGGTIEEGTQNGFGSEGIGTGNLVIAAPSLQRAEHSELH